MDLRKISLDELNLELEKRTPGWLNWKKSSIPKKKIVEDLKMKVSEALMGFENKGLTVTNRDGKVYLSLDEKLLFKSASWDIDANGQNALKLAAVLERESGHPDHNRRTHRQCPLPPGKRNLSDRWDLSVKRGNYGCKNSSRRIKNKPLTPDCLGKR
ncbi:MAG: hypothetical protein IPI69_16265 [Bacteroidales bacterium]|nr:hypothetical protein [Bacteroidales bacterium]